MIPNTSLKRFYLSSYGAGNSTSTSATTTSDATPPRISPERIARITQEVSDFLRATHDDSEYIYSATCEAVQDMMDTGQRAAVVLVNVDFENFQSAEYQEICEPSSDEFQKVWTETADWVSQDFRNNGIPLTITTNFSRNNTHELIEQDHSNGFHALGVARCADDDAGLLGKFVSEEDWILITPSVRGDDNIATFPHELGHALFRASHPGLSIFGVTPEFTELDPAFKAWLCQSSPDQAGSVMVYQRPELCGDYLIGRRSRHFGLFDVALAQLRFNGSVDPELERKIVDEVVRKAADIPEFESPLQPYGTRVTQHFAAAFAGQLARRSMDYAAARLGHPDMSPTERKAVKFLTETIAQAVQACVLVAMGRDLTGTMEILGITAAGRLVMETVSPEALTALANLIGALNLGIAIHEWVMGYPMIAGLSLIGALLGHDCANIVTTIVEALLQKCCPEADPERRKLLASTDLVIGNVYPDLSGWLKTLQLWSDSIRYGITEYVGLNCLRSYLYKPDSDALNASPSNTPAGYAEKLNGEINGEKQPLDQVTVVPPIDDAKQNGSPSDEDEAHQATQAPT